MVANFSKLSGSRQHARKGRRMMFESLQTPRFLQGYRQQQRLWLALLRQAGASSFWAAFSVTATLDFSWTVSVEFHQIIIDSESLVRLLNLCALSLKFWLHFLARFGRFWVRYRTGALQPELGGGEGRGPFVAGVSEEGPSAVLTLC